MPSKIKGIVIGNVRIGKRAPFKDALEIIAEINVETIVRPIIVKNIIIIK